ncbi:MAG TPA: hypothetical protein VGP68_24270 [Gemmataceae bacterium]|jgi:hypothetical protein|nr:hypothetical protein [Gemmataceae bacterium]
MGRIENLLLLAAALWMAAGEFVDFPDIPAVVFPNAKAAKEDALILQLMKQRAPHFRQLYRSELHFMRLVCQPTKAQFEKISKDGEASLKEITKKFALKMHEQEQGKMISPGEAVDPQASIAEAIAKSVRKMLSPDQASRYQKELNSRSDARKRTNILGLVAKADDVLFLAADQRAKLRNILEEKWNPSLNQTQIVMAGREYFPPMPDTEILTILTESQRNEWRGLTKEIFAFDFDFGEEVIELDDEVWTEDRLPPNRNKMDNQPSVKIPASPNPAEKK